MGGRHHPGRPGRPSGGDRGGRLSLHGPLAWRLSGYAARLQGGS